MSVVRLVDRVPAPVDGRAGLCEWLRAWADAIELGEYGDTRSLILVVENMDGRVAALSQSVAVIDKPRMVGLLTCAAHYKMEGHADIQDLAC